MPLRHRDGFVVFDVPSPAPRLVRIVLTRDVRFKSGVVLRKGSRHTATVDEDGHYGVPAPGKDWTLGVPFSSAREGF